MCLTDHFMECWFSQGDRPTTRVIAGFCVAEVGLHNALKRRNSRNGWDKTDVVEDHQTGQARSKTSKLKRTPTKIGNPKGKQGTGEARGLALAKQKLSGY